MKIKVPHFKDIGSGSNPNLARPAESRDLDAWLGGAPGLSEREPAISPVSLIGAANSIPVEPAEVLPARRSPYGGLADAVPGMVYRRYLREDDRVQYFNDMSLPLTGFTAAELHEADLFGHDHLILAADRPRVCVGRALAIQRGQSFELEYRIRHRDGEIRHFSERGAVVLGSDRRPAYLDGVILDVSEQTRLARSAMEKTRALQAVSTQLLCTHEAERAHFARELHDGIGQALTTIKFRIEDILVSGKEGNTLSRNRLLECIVPTIQQAIEEIQRVSMGLRPSVLDDFGVLAAVSWACREFRLTHPSIRLQCIVHIREDEIPDLLKTVIYRILQEALNNVAKHAKADHVTVCLKSENGRIEFGVEDNGTGFTPGEATRNEPNQRGLGLTSMKQRVQLSNGSFAIDSVRGCGTKVRASWSQRAARPAEQPLVAAGLAVELAAFNRDPDFINSG